MQGMTTLLMILTPMFLGFFLPKNTRLALLSEKLLNYIVFLLLILIGIELALVDNLLNTLTMIAIYLPTLVVLTVGSGLLGLYIFDKISPCPYRKAYNSTNKNSLSIHGSLVQLACLVAGFVLGRVLPDWALPPHGTNTALLMLLLFTVGILLKNSQMTLTQALLNKRGLLISVIYMIVVLGSGLIFAGIFGAVSWQQGLALSAGFGWYSLSGSIMTDAYGAMWGSVALLNDLSREILAMLFIPYVMRFSSSSAIGLAGVTGLDFTLPILQKAGGNDIIPLVISFGFITNVVSPILMVFFSALGK